jgi:hypothetical protein
MQGRKTMTEVIIKQCKLLAPKKAVLSMGKKRALKEAYETVGMAKI